MISQNNLKQLGDVVDFLDSKRKPIKASERVPGPYPYYGANGKIDSVADYLFDESLVLLAEDGGHFFEPHKGIAYIASGKYWVNNHAHVLKPKSNIDISYLYHSLRNRDLSSYLTGSTRAKLTKSSAEKIQIPLPPLEEQKCIARILDTADEIRNKRSQSIEELNRLAQSVFLDMFGDPVTNPKRWDIGTLEQLGKLDRGVSKHRPRNAPELLGGPYPLIQTGDISRSNGYVESYSSTYSEIGFKQSKIWHKGTLCITIAANIASTGILKFDACFPDSVVGFSANNQCSASYVQGLFWFFKEILERRAPQVAQKNINLKILRELPIPVPPIILQEKFDIIIDRIYHKKNVMRQHLTELDSLFASLQSRAFNGTL